MMESQDQPIQEDVNLWIVEDNSHLRTYLHKYLNEQDNLVCSMHFSNMEALLDALNEHSHPHLILTDLGLPGMSGSDGIRRIKEMAPKIEILVLTVHEDREKVFDAINAGASGYLLKNTSIHEIAEGCLKVSRGEASLDGLIARMMLNSFQDNSKTQESEIKLTKRELEILNLLAEGFMAKEIAQKLYVSMSTVSFHSSNIYKKLHVSNQRGAIHEARKHGLL
ncbi:MAG: response regulator transcription factor [Planctomycetes bacterium]|nr:response regulator transcription factor [Planctomycetota bacterium]